MNPVSDAADVTMEPVVLPERLPDLVELFSSQWWTSDRTAKDVIRMLARSDIVVAAVDRTSDRLVGFARVITDFTYVALILDVIVEPEFHGRGIGAMIMESVVTHPRLAGVRSLELVCQPDVVGFYGRLGLHRASRQFAAHASNDRRAARVPAVAAIGVPTCGHFQ